MIGLGAGADKDFRPLSIWTPAKLIGHGLTAWYEARTIVSNEGQPVTTWPDLSGGGHPMLQATPSKQGVKNVSGKATYVTMDATDDAYEPSPIFFPAESAGWCISILEIPYNQGVGRRTIQSAGLSAVISPSRNDGFGYYLLNLASNAPVSPIGVPVIASMGWDPTLNQIKVWVNGTDYSIGLAGFAWSVPVIGAAGNAPSEPAATNLIACVIYNINDRLLVEKYLKSLY